MTYYQAGNSISSCFFMVPKSLLSEQFSQISANAKLMFIQMLDRCKLSIKNNWVDETKNIFIIYPVEQLAKAMNLKKSKVHMLLNELETAHLIKRKRSGGSLPNKIYIANLDAQMEANKNAIAMEEEMQKDYEAMRKSNYYESYQYAAYDKNEAIVIEDEKSKSVHEMNTNLTNKENEEEKTGGIPAHIREKLYDTLGMVYNKFGVNPSKESVVVGKSDVHECGGQNNGYQTNDVHEYGHQESTDIHGYGHQNTGDIHDCGHQNIQNAKNTTIYDKKQHDIHEYGDQNGTDIHKHGDHCQGDVHETENMTSTIVDTNNNKYNNNKNSIIINACARAKEESSSSTDVSDAVKYKINYDALVTANPECIAAIDTIVDVMTDVSVQNNRDSLATVSIGDRSVPYKDVAAKYSMLKFCDINNVIHAAKDAHISNPKRYYLVCLYRKGESITTLKSRKRDEFKGNGKFNNFIGRDLTNTIAQLERMALGA